MALTTCKDCGTSISRRAKTCPKCGAPAKRGSSLLRLIGLCFVVFMGFSVIAAIAGKAKPQAASASTPTQVASPQSQANKTPKYSPKDDQTYPFKLVTLLSQSTTFGGIPCGLAVEGQGWHKSKFDGVWNAVLRRHFGPNEVSCLLESSTISTVQRIELEAEFYQPGLHESAMLLQFSQSAQILMYPTTPSREFAEAVVNKRKWSNDQWELTRNSYANGGFGLMLRRKPH